MACPRPAPILRVFGGKAQVVEIVLVEEFGRAVWARGPDQCRNRVDRELEVLFACSQGRLRPRAFGDFLFQFLIGRGKLCGAQRDALV